MKKDTQTNQEENKQEDPSAYIVVRTELVWGAVIFGVLVIAGYLLAYVQRQVSIEEPQTSEEAHVHNDSHDHPHED